MPKRSFLSNFRCIIVFAALVACLGCSSQIPLTPSLIREYKLSGEDMKKLQLYVSDGILLEQEMTRINKDIDDRHGLKTVEDSYVNQIFFKRYTPCIAAEAKADRLEVSFEPEDRLTFVLEPSRPKGGYYVYQPDKKAKPDKAADRLPRSGFKNWTVIGAETYRDSSYIVLVRDNPPILLVDQTGLKKIKVERRPIKGMRLVGE